MEIKRGIPIPSPCNARYPFALLDIGECFDAPLCGEYYTVGGHEIDRTTSRLCRAASNFKRRHQREFTVRTLKADGVVRCWRVA